MALDVTALTLMAQALADDVVQVSLHSSNPGSTGANETTAGRQVPAWDVAAGALSLSAAESFTGGASNGPVTHCGLWAAGNVWRGSFPVTGDASFNSAGEYDLDDITITGS